MISFQQALKKKPRKLKANFYAQLSHRMVEARAKIREATEVPPDRQAQQIDTASQIIHRLTNKCFQFSCNGGDNTSDAKMERLISGHIAECPEVEIYVNAAIESALETLHDHEQA